MNCKHGRPLVSVYPCPDCKYEAAAEPIPGVREDARTGQPVEYRDTVNVGREFARRLGEGDGGFEDNEVNRVALECCIAGWLWAQIRVQAMRKADESQTRDDFFLIVQDWAVQAADDAAREVGMRKRFVRHPRTSDCSAQMTRLERKIRDAKRRLGITI